MKISYFKKTIQEKMTLRGYSTDHCGSFDRNQMNNIFRITLNACFVFIYILHVTKTPREQMYAIFMCSVTILVLVSYVSTLSKQPIIFASAVKLGEIVDESEHYWSKNQLKFYNL